MLQSLVALLHSITRKVSRRPKQYTKHMSYLDVFVYLYLQNCTFSENTSHGGCQMHILAECLAEGACRMKPG